MMSKIPNSVEAVTSGTASKATFSFRSLSLMAGMTALLRE
jgi:hypothetical protein